MRSFATGLALSTPLKTCDRSSSMVARSTLVVLFAAGVACTPATSNIGATVNTVKAAALGPGDVFDVSVFGEDELSGRYRVGADGTITFPLVGSVAVKGLTTNEASEVIAEGLRAYVKNPHVSIFVQ